MKPSSLTGHTLEALALVLAGRRPADAVIGEFFRARRYLGSADRRFIAESSYGVLRHYRFLEALALRALGRPDGSPVEPVALVAAREAAATDADPETIAQAIDDRWSVGGKGCAEFVRAVRAGASCAAALPRAVRHSIPDFVAGEWEGRFPPAEAEALCEASNAQPPLALRVNTLKGDVASCARALEAEGIVPSPGTLSPVALVLPRRVNTLALASFRGGLFEMQDEGSQLIAPLLEAEPGMTVLDACAGGGGKSLHLAALMENRGEVRALDVDRGRLENLRLRARRAGAGIVHSVLLRRGSPPPGAGAFDAVLIDAPCSGTGTFRRNPWAKRTCTPAYAASLAVRQAELLRLYAPSVKRGGRLVYATCTLLEAENGRVVKEFLASRPDFSLLSAGDLLARRGIRFPGAGPTLELFPHRTGTDGYFAAVMVRA